jgi:hypothetical protein
MEYRYRTLILLATCSGVGARGVSAQNGTSRYHVCLQGYVLPTVLLIGAQKCGTTSLSDDLNRVFPTLARGVRPLPRRFSSNKELHFFDDPAMTKLGLPMYASRFPQCSSQGAQLGAIDSTPIYLRSAFAASQIRGMYPADVLPRLRFLVCLRHPSQRFRSWFDHKGVRLHMEVNAFVQLALEKTHECARLKGIDARSTAALFESCGHPQGAGDSLSAGWYAPQLQLYLRLFDPSQLAIISFGGYIREPVAVLEQLGGFLGLEPHLERRRLAASGAQDARPAALESWGARGRPVSTSARAHGTRAFEPAHSNSRRRKHVLNPRMRALLDAFFEPSVVELGALLDEQSKRGMVVLPRGILETRAAANASETEVHAEIGRIFLADP